MARHGLAFSGFAQDLWSEHLLDTRDTSHYVASFQANCDFAVDLGIKGVRVDTVQPPTIHREADYADLLNRLVATWDRCIGYAGDKGLYVTWEFEPGFAFNKPSDIQRVLDKLQHDNFGILYDTCHGQMVSVVGARQEGRKETLPGGQLELIARLSGRINHIHLIDSDNSCHKAADGSDETSAHPPFGEGAARLRRPGARPRQGEGRPRLVDGGLVFLAGRMVGHGQVQDALDALNKKYG